MISTFDENFVNTMITNLSSAISRLKTESANIDEKYRKMLEEEKASLNEAIEETGAQLNYWYTVRGDVPAAEKKRTRKPRAKKEDVVTETPEVKEETVEEVIDTRAEEEKVVDNLFVENNEPEETVEEAVEEGTEESPEPDSMEEDLNSIWPDEPVEEGHEPGTIAEEHWPETERADEEPVEESASEEEWPDFPADNLIEEWK